ncbi:hypothetical protein MJO28_012242 [Puccinia striiformis f. sp. tritici]|uniref:Uncharacterized protein n=2 Tax=Puccinia striiformis TaxID=27350 RepID=A0A2S4W0Y5_9BASI|nr:hypothetical protein Pst134EB_033094 [Puccinia striiformis f. sp. tritici]KAI7942215.1 hypothetical protein MJO28_012242 [Puccinia striiformis f. sp. tritici]POW15347.1 hypothetical protein PSTT_02263 [Puccinia striiformis]
MPISALRICLVIIFSLLGLIDGGTCSFPNVEDTLEHACDDFQSLRVARYTGTETLAGDEDELPVSEIDGVISKETIKEGAGQSDLIKQRGEKAFPKISSDWIKEASQKRIWRKTNKIYTDFNLGLKKDSHKKFQSSLQIIWHILAKFSLDPNAQNKIYSTEEETQRLTSIMNQVKEISILLLDRENIPESYHSNAYAGILNLSDMLGQHLAFSIRYKLMQDDTLEQFLNHKDHWMITYNYFWGNFLQNTDLTSQCLNQGLEHDLQEVPFTNHMQDYFRFLNKNTLFHLSRINIAMRMLHVAASDDYISCDFFSLAREFILVTSIKSQELPSGIETNFNALASKIFNELLKFQEDKITIRLGKTMRYSKILLDTLEFLKKNMPIESIWELDQLPFDTQVRFGAIEEAFGYFSTGLKLVYSKYVRTIQLEALGSFKQKYKPSILYLTQIYTKDEVSNYTPKMYERHNKNTSLIIAQTNLILKKLKNIEDSDRRSIKQLHEDKENLEEILNEPIDDYITREYMK